MPDLDANDGLARLPGVPGERLYAAEIVRTLLRYLDVALVVVATPVALALGAPALGYGIAAGAWILQRALAQLDRRWIRNGAEPRVHTGRSLFEAFGRIWLLAGAIVAAGVIGGRPDGLTAALLIFVAYSICFAVRLAGGRPPAESRP